MKRIVKEYFIFSKKERNAAIILLLLVTVFLAAPHLYTPKTLPPKIGKELEAYLDNDSVSNTDFSSRNTWIIPAAVADTNPGPVHLFVFDPNTIPETGWKKLGLPDKLIRTISNYRNKGGQFRQATDIRKIWGLSKEMADRLIPYININLTGKDDYQKRMVDTIHRKHPAETANLRLDINAATPDDWKKLRGIGDVLANRIVRFREKTGGFVSVEQVRKTYGISDSLWNTIWPFLFTGKPATGMMLDINKASAADIVTHTGISRGIANSIITYRNQNGNYLSIDDLKKIAVVSDSVFEQIRPHVFVPKQD
jgi:competence ComEA-like helix-hairpin-helix protein